MAQEAERYLSEIETGELLKVSPRTLQRWRNREGGPRFVRLGARRIAYRASDLAAWAEGNAFASKVEEKARKAA